MEGFVTGMKKNILYNISYQFLIIFLPLITTPYISRVIGAEGVGVYSYTYSIISYFMLFAMLGLNNYGNRSIAIVRNNKYELSQTFFDIYGLQVLTSITMIVLYVIYIYIFVSSYRDIYYIQTLFLLSSLLDINWFFFGLEQFKLTVIRNTLVKLVTVIAIFVFVKDSNDLWIYTLIMASGTLSSQIILWIFIKRYLIWVKPKFKGMLNHLKPNLILFIPVLAVSIYRVMDKIMLGLLTSTLQVAYYENAEKVINIPVSIISALGIVMLPRMTSLITVGNISKVQSYIEYSLKFVMFIAIGSCVGLLGIAPNFIPLFLGVQFTESIYVVSVLSFTLLFTSFANVIRTQYLIPQQKDRVYIISTLLGAILNILSNLIFIPIYGAVGAAIGTVISEATVAFYQIIKVRGNLRVFRYFLNSYIYIIPAFFMFIVINLVNQYTTSPVMTLVIQIILGGGVYIFLSGVFLIVTDKTIYDKLLK